MMPTVLLLAENGAHKMPLVDSAPIGSSTVDCSLLTDPRGCCIHEEAMSADSHPHDEQTEAHHCDALEHWHPGFSCSLLGHRTEVSAFLGVPCKTADCLLALQSRYRSSAMKACSLIIGIDRQVTCSEACNSLSKLWLSYMFVVF